MTKHFIDVHVLQTVPPSNLNRDDTGSPKTAVYGGVRRARVSSQAWKRATRTAFADILDPGELGVRTKDVVKLLGDRIAALAPELAPDANAQAESVFAALKIGLEPSRRKKEDKNAPPESKYLLFLSSSQLDRLAKLAVESAKTGAALDKKAAIAAAKGPESVDVSLFGRMVADAADLNVDAAVQVAHALSVHGVENEFDYFTAVDDRAPEDSAGAGMIGTVEFNSSTLYRYATLNVALLRENLGNEDVTDKAIAAFLEAFVKSMPTGKQNTFANRTFPDAVFVSVRTDQPANLVNAFETPVTATDSSARSAQAAAELAKRYESLETAFGDGSAVSFAVANAPGVDVLGKVAELVPFPELAKRVVDQVNANRPSA